MVESRFAQLLARIRRREVLVGGAAGFALAVTIALVTLAASAWLDLVWELSSALRVTALAAAGLAAAIALAVLAARILAAVRDAALARRLDQTAAAAGVILTGWELAAAPSMPARRRPSDAALSQGLSLLAAERAFELGRGVPPAAVVDVARLRRALAALAIVLGALAIAALCFPSLMWTEWQRFTRPFADIPPYSLIQFAVHPGDADVVYGDALDVHAEVSGATIEKVDLVIEESGHRTSLPMFQEPSGRWRTSLARITEPAVYFVEADRARSPRYSIRVITVPEIESVRFRVQAPEYTREAAYEGPLPKAGLVGLAGTKVRVWAKSNRPLWSGTIALTSEASSADVVMLPSGRDFSEVTGEFEITATGRFEITVYDVGSQASREPFRATVTLIEDQRPFARLLEPRAMSLATPNVALPVAVSAEDDYGISRVQLFRSLNESRPMATELAVATPPPRRAEQRVYLPLSTYGLSPGDEIKLFARVEDNDPAGAKGAETPVACVRIISQEEFERMLRVRQGLDVLVSKYQQARRRMERLAAELEELRAALQNAPSDGPIDEQTRDALKRLAKRMQDEAAAIGEQAAKPLPYDLDENLTQELERLAQAASQAAEALASSASLPGMDQKALAEELDELERSLDGARDRFDRDAVEPLDHLASVFPLLEDQARFIDLVRRQRDLADRMASFRGLAQIDDPSLKARMRELEGEQRRTRDELNELLDDIVTHVARLPEEPAFDDLRRTAAEFASAVRASGAAEAMADAESQLAVFDGASAHENAARAAAILASFIKQCEGMGGDCEGCLAFQPTLGRSMGNTLSQLLAEAGLGMSDGSGFGPGAGGIGGYSARRGMASQLGLYGGLPYAGADSGAGQDGGSLSGAASGGRLGASGEREATTLDAERSGLAGGAGAASVPAQYRQRVGQYFQRINEEVQ